jgi:hypothetical protein
MLDDAHVVGDEDVGQAELALELLEQVEDLGLDGNVQRRHGLVAHDQVGFEDERASDPDPLPLAARELVGIAAGVVWLQPDLVHHLADLLPPLGVAAETVDAQALADAVTDRRPRVQARIGVLEDDLHPPSIRLERGALDRRDVRSIELDPARRGVEEPQDHPPDRGLAAARLAHQAEGLAAADLEADPVDRLDRPDLTLQDPAADREMLDEVCDLDERPFGGLRRGRPVWDGSGAAGGRRSGLGRERAHAGAASTGGG